MCATVKYVAYSKLIGFRVLELSYPHVAHDLNDTSCWHLNERF